MSVLSVVGGRPLRGRLRVPGDKSVSHRALLLGALADGTSTVRDLSAGEDVARTRAVVEALGAVVDGELGPGGEVTVKGRGGELAEPDHVLDVGNSGTGIRLLMGLCAAQPFLSVLAGDASVARRPMGRVADPLRMMGARIDGRDGGRLPPVVVRGGGLHGIGYELPVASAQVKSAVLLAGLGAAGETTVRQPALTRAHTEELLRVAGADLDVSPDGLTVRLRPSTLRPLDLDVPGDPSQAAFWVVAACVVPGSDVVVERTYLGPARDGFLAVLGRMGADLDVDRASGDVRARWSDRPLRATDVEPDEVPGLVDEIPVLAVAMALAEGTSTVRGAEELRVKETDRVATVASELGALGAAVDPRPDGLVIDGGGPGSLRPAAVRSHGDHRIAMAAAVAAAACGSAGETTIDGWDAVATSYPGFADDLEALRS